MLLKRGWKTFACAHHLAEGHILRFKLVETDMISIKVFRRSGAFIGCCMEISSDNESSSSSDSDEENTDGEDGDDEPWVIKHEDNNLNSG